MVDGFVHDDKDYSYGKGGEMKIGFYGLLAIVFIVLKLTDVIHWSWWWVLSPLWIIPASFLLIIVPIALLRERTKNKRLLRQWRG